MILFRFEGRGILAPVFFIIPIVVLTILCAIVRFGFHFDLFSWFDSNIISGVSLLISAFLTKRYGEKYYTDLDGKRVKVEQKNTFIFMPMKYIAIIEIVIGLGKILEGLYHTFLMC
jgi:hypothetical protein